MPIRLVLALGAVLPAAGLLLFVSAHWDSLSPGHRFTLRLALVVGLHGLATGLARRFAALPVALHGVGTVALGGRIFLAGQIFHVEAHWPTGLLLWAVGAAVGWILLGLMASAGAAGAAAEPARRLAGGMALLPAAVAWGVLATVMDLDSTGLPLPLPGWGVALGGPLLLGWLLRRRAIWLLGGVLVVA